MDDAKFLKAAILQIVWTRPNVHGYEVAKLLESDYGFDNVSAVMYRRMRRLDADLLVSSSWLESSIGPRRRVYTITGRGLSALSALDAEVRQDRDVKSAFIQRAEAMSA
jgi:DNA-binding PadR family transcriptional regulator